MNGEHMLRILAPVDFSDLSALALRYAVAVAKCSNARVTALYADQFLPPPYFTERQIAGVQEQLKDSRRQALDALAAFAKTEAGETAPVEVEIAEGLPADAIRRRAEELRPGMIVMGTHGRSGVNRLMLGSVAERVLRETEVPLLVVRQDYQPANIRRILCPVNNSAPARQALSVAASLARCAGATVSVVHIKDPAEAEPIQDLCSWIPESERNVCSASELTATGDVARDVIALAAESHADLLVIGARHRTFFDTTILGANTVRMIRHAPCPVLSVFAPA